MKKVLLIALSPLLMYGQIYTQLQCTSLSGKSNLMVKNPSFDDAFERAIFSIENKRLIYNEVKANNRVVNRLEDGVFTLSYEDSTKKLILHALPESIKKIESKIVKANYIFDAIISNQSTDPRKKSTNVMDDAYLDYDIKVECTFTIGTIK